MKNALFIMCDQLRADYLSCTGHPHLHTPHIDRLAQMGVTFSRAYVQSPICGPSRASFYTGRYAFTHGATLNYAPLPLSELGLGDYLRPLGIRTAVSGKTHMVPNTTEMERLGIDPASAIGQNLAELGFEPYFRDDGVHSDQNPDQFSDYNAFLRQQGYEHPNPWHRYANGSCDENDQFRSGWFFEHSDKPADIPEALSETTVTTSKGIDFISEATAAGQPWCLHLSYIKPHWPVIAPAPYHDMYGPETVLPANRTEAERQAPHSVIAAYMQLQDCQLYTDPAHRTRIIQTYMGLVKQIDDQIGRLLNFLEENDLLKETLIVFTSDHGDYLGDHWLGEKDLFHEASVRVPMLVVDPDRAADGTRGCVDDRFVEAIDVVPTLIDYFGGDIPEERLEGRSLLPLTRQDPDNPTQIEWRYAVVSEIDYAFRKVREWLGIEPINCRATMFRVEKWKYIHYEGFPPQLFDLENDPEEQQDLGEDPKYEAIRHILEGKLFKWFRQRKVRATLSDARIKEMFGGWNQVKRGVYVGYWSDEDLPDLKKATG